MKNNVMLPISILFLGLVVLAQGETLSQWVKKQDTENTVVLRNRANDGALIGYTTNSVTYNQDQFVVLLEKVVKQVAVAAGITKSDTLQQADDKLKTWMGSDPVKVYQAAQFWVGYNELRNVDPSTSTTYTVDTVLPEYALSPAQSNGWGTVTSDDIEKAMRE